MTLQLTVNGEQVEVDDEGLSLLEVLRDRLGLRAAKDGCSPQGQCGCCTVWVDGEPRVACVTPARRVRNRSVTTLEGLPVEQRSAWANAFTACGASQCGFCTPGIIMRLAALDDPGDGDKVDTALLAHLCRCTGWQTIHEAAALVSAGGFDANEPVERDLVAAARRAAIEGGVPQEVGPHVATGQGGFADDTSPLGADVAVLAADDSWTLGRSLAEARRTAGKVQGRRTTVEPRHPVSVPDGDWDLVLQTTWVEPGYLEPDASWCAPGATPASALGNGGAFGGKMHSPVPAAAAELANGTTGDAIRALWSREDTVWRGPKRPPLAAGINRDRTGSLRVVRTSGIADAVAAMAPGLAVEEVDVAGPPTSVDLRGAGWVEAAVLLAALGAIDDPRSAAAEGIRVMAPGGGSAKVSFDGARFGIEVSCGAPLDSVVLRSYCIGATHMAYSWVTSEGIAVDDDGRVHDLTIRSFGIVRARDMPPVDVVVAASDDEPVNGSDAVFAAAAAATWLHEGLPPTWPTRGRNP